jgi:hypothetical protein
MEYKELSEVDRHERQYTADLVASDGVPHPFSEECANKELISFSKRAPNRARTRRVRKMQKK